MKLPVTIKGAMIGGLFAIVAAIIPIAYTMYSTKPSVEKGQTASEKELRKIICSYIGSSNIDVVPPGIIQTSFNPNGNKRDFYAQIISGENKYIVAFASKPAGYENVYFNKLKHGFFWEVKHITLNSRSYLVCYSVTGSGHYLDLSIYAYDGIGKLKEVFNKGELFQGNIYIADNAIHINGNGHKYKVVFKNNKFNLEEYKEKLKPAPDSGTHVLSYKPQGTLLKVMYDGKEVKFRKTGEKGYDSKETFEIKLDEQIIDDDNIVGYPPQYIRLLIQDELFDFIDGFFTTIKPVKVGETSINLSHDYEEWYHIKFKITK